MKKFIFMISLMSSLSLFSQSLWNDVSPYSTGQKGQRGAQVGSIIRVVIKEGIRGEYIFESKKDETVTIKHAPDKKIIAEQMGYNFDRSIARHGNGKERSGGKIVGVIAVTVTEIEAETGNLIIEGEREVSFDKGRNNLRISGKFSPLDLKDGNTITSDLIANLVMEYTASPVPLDLNDPDVKMKPAKMPDGTPQVNPDGTPMEKAELNETEKQKVIMKNIKRLLGESE
ncbi:MAG: flagellar basal body L-ring protein FlgH [Leptospiraceae bacterium]|nr:flagellar basal body L-ring protein FlgH [Leptospiraceae bacterium]